MSPYAACLVAAVIAVLAWVLYESWRHLGARGVNWECRLFLCGIAALQLGHAVFWLIDRITPPIVFY
jgi:hypothetical protein